MGGGGLGRGIPTKETGVQERAHGQLRGCQSLGGPCRDFSLVRVHTRVAQRGQE